MRWVTVEIHHRREVVYRRIINILLTCDAKVGLQAHLVVEVEDGQAKGDRKAAVDLGETQVISALFDDGTALLYSGGKIKSIRGYWQKVRRSVKPPNEKGPRKSRRYRQIDRKERRQVNHLLHIITRDFVERCYDAGVNTIAVGDLNGICGLIDCGKRLNQRLHNWPYARITNMLEYKARLRGIEMVRTDEKHTSQRCHECGKMIKSNSKKRGWHRCDCGWETHADINAAANLFERAFNGSSLRSSGAVAAPRGRACSCEWAYGLRSIER